jgi:hypothetical protein
MYPTQQCILTDSLCRLSEVGQDLIHPVTDIHNVMRAVSTQMGARRN